MSRRRSRNPNASHAVIFAENTTLGWRVAKHMPLHLVETMVDQRKARHVIDKVTGELIGYQLCEREFFGNGVVVAPGGSGIGSSASISARENVANAGTHFKGGRSQTAGLSAAEKANRLHPLSGRLLPEEDAAELIAVKVASFAGPVDKTTPDKSTTVYPGGLVTGQYRRVMGAKRASA